jgi:hypothetical protein
MKRALSSRDLLFIFGTNVVLIGAFVACVWMGHWVIGLLPLLGLRVYRGNEE